MSWTAEQLTELRGWQHIHKGDLDLISDEVGRPRLQVNLALDALIGRTPAAAADALADRTGPAHRVKSFVKGLFSARP